MRKLILISVFFFTLSSLYSQDKEVPAKKNKSDDSKKTEDSKKVSAKDAKKPAVKDAKKAAAKDTKKTAAKDVKKTVAKDVKTPAAKETSEEKEKTADEADVKEAPGKTGTGEETAKDVPKKEAGSEEESSSTDTAPTAKDTSPGAKDAGTDTADKPKEEPAEKTSSGNLPAFRGPNLLHMPTVQPLQKDILDFRFNHRFGNANNTLHDFFGLDQGANTLLALDYGITDKFSAGISRISSLKTYEARTKYFLVPQSESFPVSIALFGAAGTETQKQVVTMGPYIIPPSTGFSSIDTEIKNRLNQYELSQTDRTSYMASALVSRRFNDKFSLQISPMLVHKNFVKPNVSNNRYGLDIGGKYQISKSFAFLFEMIFTQKRDYKGDNYATVDQQGYGNINTLTGSEINSTYYRPTDLGYVYMRNVYNDKPVPYYSIPLSLGMSYESGGHIYQVFVTNTRALAHTALLKGADFDYRNREWTIGFNINRFFSFAKEVSEDNF
ncbi:MAG TPA: DUF5777 family beta-barrel protein [Leptospiraceae bacterium]|nr:DUF5777 family beta-barrel protein [Leptospiraceae bacterium]HNF17078.1 DUF5777 family beta-barrel protein [Leptospiraceae bacterium]HNF27701.1 DUF5777 family beta-barrel protein [Leptospiraceae bacterium]HNI25906.1 DUF5777 family beta-barrel protein [Leptospiraceae bacterium]HNI99228.1 DUF5777 family beta-barrel protein [Leptospiraceae bacterium]